MNKDFPFQYGDPADKPKALNVTEQDNIPCNAQQQAQTERRQGCADLGPRNRRADMRVTDIHRIVNTAMEKLVSPAVLGGGTNQVNTATGQKALTLTSGLWDKNTPESLKQLRWAIYEAVDNCHARTSSTELNKEIERLFQEYTHS